jgi:hypothetical protein
MAPGSQPPTVILLQAVPLEALPLPCLPRAAPLPASRTPTLLPAPPPGADYDAAPDLDHANPQLREALVDWLKWLQADIVSSPRPLPALHCG